MLYFFCGQSRKKWPGNNAYQELIHMPIRVRRSIINHIRLDADQGTPEKQLQDYLPDVRKFAIILGFAQS